MLVPSTAEYMRNSVWGVHFNKHSRSYVKSRAVLEAEAVTHWYYSPYLGFLNGMLVDFLGEEEAMGEWKLYGYFLQEYLNFLPH